MKNVLKLEKELETKLNEIAKMTEEEARQVVINEARDKYEREIAQKFKEIKESLRRRIKKITPDGLSLLLFKDMHQMSPTK